MADVNAEVALKKAKRNHRKEKPWDNDSIDHWKSRHSLADVVLLDAPMRNSVFLCFFLNCLASRDHQRRRRQATAR